MRVPPLSFQKERNLKGNGGVYQFVFRMKKDALIRVGAAGTYRVPAAIYVYTGTAQRGLAQRIARHASKDKPVKWHVDYLTAHPDAEPVAAYCAPGAPAGMECALAVRAIVNADFLLAKLGNSDCRFCASHVCGFFGEKTPVKLFSGLVEVDLGSIAGGEKRRPAAGRIRRRQKS